MSPSDKMKLSTMSYNWTDLEKATLDPQSDYTNYANSSVSAEIDVSKYCKTDLHSCGLVRVEFDVVLEVDGSCGPNPYGTTTLTASVTSCSVVLDSKTQSSANGISINAIQNTIYTQFLIPTSSGYDVYSDQSLSEKVGETYSNEIVIRARGSISGRPPTCSMTASVSGDVHFYAVL